MSDAEPKPRSTWPPAGDAEERSYDDQLTSFTLTLTIADYLLMRNEQRRILTTTGRHVSMAAILVGALRSQFSGPS